MLKSFRIPANQNHQLSNPLKTAPLDNDLLKKYRLEPIKTKNLNFDNVFSSFKDNFKKMDFESFDVDYNKICIHQFLKNYNPLINGSFIEIGPTFVRNAFFYPDKWEINDFLLTIRSLKNEYLEPKLLTKDIDAKNDILLDQNFMKRMLIERDSHKFEFNQYEWKFVLFSSDYRELIYQRVADFASKSSIDRHDDDLDFNR